MEGREQLAELDRAHADAVVHHLQQQHARCVRGDAQFDMATAPVVLDAVAKQVDQHLAQALRVGLHRQRWVLQVQAQGDLGAHRNRLDQQQGFVQQIGQGHRLR